MTNKEEIQFINDNRPTYEAWLSVNAALQPGSDLIAPLIKIWERETGHSLTICTECILDVVRFCLNDYKLKED